jgi:hypothetical protein
MIPRRYAVILALLAGGLALLGWVATLQAAAAVDAADEIVFDNSRPVADDIIGGYYQQLALGEQWRVLPAWALLAAFVAAIAAVTLLVLRSRRLMAESRD